MLKDYIEALATRIISSRQERGIRPAACTLNEMMDVIRQDVMECMRALHTEGKFNASVTVNKIPMLLSKEQV